MSIDTMSDPAIGDAAADDLSAVEHYQRYKSLSTAAVASAALGVFSIFALCDWLLLLVPVFGVALGVVGLRKTLARPDEFAGAVLARVGIVLSLVLGVSAASYLTYRHVTKVPKWAAQISYEQLQPDPDRPSQIFPPEVQSLDGRKLYIEGYVLQSKDMHNIREFILCRDKGDCCFGGNPKLTDRIQVRLMGGKSIDYSLKLFAVAGTFHLRPSQAKGLSGGVIYHMDAEFVQ